MRLFKPSKFIFIFKRMVSLCIVLAFVMTTVCSPAQAQTLSMVQGAFTVPLPMPGVRINLSASVQLPILQGITIHPDNPLRFDFIVSHGDRQYATEDFQEESLKLVKYFLASLTTPEDEMWVNLSPYESDRIIPENFGYTEMGRDLLAQDYILKQLTASLMYPEDELGKEFWDKVQERMLSEFGTTEIPANTFNKVWIVPEDASVYERDNSVFVTGSHLRVMMEEDYFAQQEEARESAIDKGAQGFATSREKQEENEASHDITAQIIKEIIIPEIEYEVNHGETFANLRQIYHSMILATWYKVALKDSLLGSIYMDQNKVKGVDVEDRDVKHKIYEQYLKAFKMGVYNYIKEEYDPIKQQIIPRKYFSGGMNSVNSASLGVFDGEHTSLPRDIQHALNYSAASKSTIHTVELNTSRDTASINEERESRVAQKDAAALDSENLDSVGNSGSDLVVITSFGSEKELYKANTKVRKDLVEFFRKHSLSLRGEDQGNITSILFFLIENLLQHENEEGDYNIRYSLLLSNQPSSLPLIKFRIKLT
ncbi:MAG: hypothetical protein ACI9E5_000100 [Candidatus Omnitrophota bacterium]|jgi:hypothetical protein